MVQIWPGRFVCKQVTVCPGHIWTTLYIHCKLCFWPIPIPCEQNYPKSVVTSIYCLLEQDWNTEESFFWDMTPRYWVMFLTFRRKWVSSQRRQPITPWLGVISQNHGIGYHTAVETCSLAEELLLNLNRTLSSPEIWTPNLNVCPTVNVDT